MSRQGFSTGHIEYLEKGFLDQLGGKINLGTAKTISLGEPKLLKIKGLSNFWEMRDEKVLSLRLFMEDILSGIHEAEIPRARLKVRRGHSLFIKINYSIIAFLYSVKNL